MLALGVACSGDDDGGQNVGDDLTLAEYFDELEQLSQVFNSDLDAVETEAEASLDPQEPRESEDEGIELFTDFVNNLRSTTDAFVGDIADLNAPAGVSEAHDQAVAAGEAVVAMYDNALTVLEGDTVETFIDATLILDGPGFTDDAQEEFGAACVALQAIADNNDLDIDMECPS